MMEMGDVFHLREGVGEVHQKVACKKVSLQWNLASSCDCECHEKVEEEGVLALK